MGTGYLLRGIACLLDAVSGANFGGTKKSTAFLRLVRMKFNKNVSDDAATNISLVAAGVALAGGTFLFVFVAIQGAA
ncbi:hypothetical protein ACFLVE_03555 [Chloroflexota bacterium]